MERRCSFAGLPDWLLQVCYQPSAAMVAAAEGKADAIHLAAEVGRLDVVSLILALLAIILGFGAIAGFWMIRSAATKAAADMAKKVAEEEAVPEARRATIEWLQAQGIDWSRIAPQPSDKPDETGQAFANAMNQDD